MIGLMEFIRQRISSDGPRAILGALKSRRGGRKTGHTSKVQEKLNLIFFFKISLIQPRYFSWRKGGQEKRTAVRTREGCHLGSGTYSCNCMELNCSEDLKCLEVDPFSRSLKKPRNPADISISLWNPEQRTRKLHHAQISDLQNYRMICKCHFMLLYLL